MLFDSRDLQLIAGGSSGCSILGILKVDPPTALFDDRSALLFVVTALFLFFLATDITLVDLSAFFWFFL